uniref:Cytochrome P450 CYP6HM1 n=1 Tax=Apolygus lucorum TaxID=248454 RepID=A0A0U2DXW7_APOLU|nr:cytochrome P450 CYP6HM1 [Apolygus lucorum]
MESLVAYVLEIGLLAAALVYLYTKLYSPFNFWKKLGVPFVKPSYPIIGETSFLFKPMEDLGRSWYDTFPNEKFYGTFQLWKPVLIVRDPELMENIMIKDFSHAYNRNNMVEPDTNPLAKHLVNYRDEKWKHLRNKLTPTFSSGKLKGMHPQLLACGDSFVKYLTKNPGDAQVKDLFGRFSMDVVSSVAFGLDLDVMNNPDSKFYEIGKSVFAPNFFVRFFFMLQSFLAPLYKKLGLNLLPKSMEKLFVDAVKQTLEYREKNNVTRQDYLHILTELKKKDDELVKNKELDPNSLDVFDEQSIISNSFVFFAAGYETTGSTLSYLFYELALNQDVQEKVYQEIKTVLEKHNDELTFEAVGEMTYVEQAINEALRLHPPGVAGDRVITKDYQIPGTDVVLPKGTAVLMQVYGMHLDPKYFPEPHAFRPERFDPEKNEIIKGTYLPFGAGPRICIAARFAKIEMKVCTAMLLKNFRVKQCSRTKVPHENDPRSFLLTPKDGIWLNFEKR